MNKLFNDVTTEFDAQDIADNKVLSLFSYLGILVLIPILGAKDSKFAKFHANQGLSLLIVGIALNVIKLILGILLGFTLYKIAVIGFIIKALVGFVFWALSIALLILEICGIVYAVQGKAIRFPYMDKFTILK